MKSNTNVKNPCILQHVFRFFCFAILLGSGLYLFNLFLKKAALCQSLDDWEEEWEEETIQEADIDRSVKVKRI